MHNLQKISTYDACLNKPDAVSIHTFHVNIICNLLFGFNSNNKTFQWHKKM